MNEPDPGKPIQPTADPAMSFQEFVTSVMPFDAVTPRKGRPQSTPERAAGIGLTEHGTVDLQSFGDSQVS
jgi:hypothetical protein